MTASNETLRVVQQFAEARRRGDRPRLSAYLDRIEEAEVAQALPQLLALALEDVPNPDWPRLEAEYVRDLDGHRDAVQAALLQLRDARRQAETAAELRPGEELPADLDLYSADATGGLTGGPVGSAAAPRLPDYEILGTIGRGGMGVVFRARQISLDRDCAVKMILHQQLADQRDLDRFEREAKLAASLNHPGIVQVFDYGECDGIPYFSMEYVAGSDLKTFTEQQGRTPRQAAELVREIADAVDYAHQRGTLHRDLKPSNILVDHQQRPKITDFGLARRILEDTQLTRTHAIAGTPSYMAPEQARGDSAGIDPRTDVYALGAVLYELLTGRPPFREATVAATLDRVQHAPPAAASSLNPAVDRDLNTICLKCLEKEPSRRYASASELSADLQRYLQRRPILARPVGWSGRAARWCRRNPALGVLAAALLAAILLGSLFAAHSTLRYRSDMAYSTAEYAAQRGNWREALEACNQALFYAGDPVRVHQLRLQAYDALNRVGDVQREIERLRRFPPQAALQARLDLWQGDARLLAGDPAGAEELLRRALQGPLAPADRRFAEGLLAETSRDAVQAFADAVREDPYHHRALLNHCLLMVLLGHHEQAKPSIQVAAGKFPEDPTFPVLLAMEESLLGDSAAARQALDGVSSALGPVQLAQFARLQTVLERLRTIPRIWDGAGDAGDPVAEMLQLQMAAGQAPTSEAEGVRVTLPYYIGRPLQQMQYVFGDVSADPATHIRRELAKIVDVHEEKLLTFVLAVAYFANQELLLAEKYLDLARGRPGVIDGLDPEIEYALAFTRLALASQQQLDDRRLLALEGVQRRLQMPPLRPTQAQLLATALGKFAEPDLAQAVLENCWAGHPQSREIGGLLIEQMLDNNNFGSAESVLRQYRRQWPEDPALAAWEAKLRPADSQPAQAQPADDQQRNR